MSNAVVLAFGQNNLSGPTDELFLKVFGGEVMTAYHQNVVTLDKHFIRQISHGKSAQFPATHKVQASYHVPGTEILGQTSPVSERVIVIDDLLTASVFLANIDEAKSHFDVRSVYSSECGIALATVFDKNVLQVGVLAARSAATVTGGDGGSTLTSPGTQYRTSATDLAAGLYEAAQKLDEKNVPEQMPRFGYVKPAQYYMLAQSTQLINRDWMGMGSYAAGKIIAIGGIQLIKTNNLPSTNVTDGPAAYRGDFTKVAALVMTPHAVGTVKLLDLAMEMEYQVSRQGTLIVAKYAMGHGILRPECAVELATTE